MKNGNKKRYEITCMLVLALAVNGAYAQADHHMMHGGHHPEKHVYLRMMDAMMVDMDTVKNQHSAEGMFLSLMRPHHSGAISMAQYEIDHGKDFEMIQLAKSILAEQKSEYMQMGLWLRNLKPLNGDVTSAFTKAMDRSMADMMKMMPSETELKDVDRSFALVMIPHHQAAVDMAKAMLSELNDGHVVNYAKLLISNEKVEIDQMSNYLSKIK